MNIKWGILSKPCIDLDGQKLYAVAWISAGGSVAKAEYQLHELDIDQPPLSGPGGMLV